MKQSKNFEDKIVVFLKDRINFNSKIKTYIENIDDRLIVVKTKIDKLMNCFNILVAKEYK